MHPRLTGLVAATPTPFRDDGALNLAAVEQEARHLATAGVGAVFIAGTTGECHSLTVEERAALTRRWVEVVRGTPMRLIVHVGHNCQQDARALAAVAGREGAHGIAALAPSYHKPASVADLIRFLVPVAAAAPQLPFYFYDIPAMTGVTLSLTDFLDQAPEQMPNLRGIKYSNPDLIQLQECLRFGDGAFDILYGIDEALLAALALGVGGAVGSSYNFAAPLFERLIAAFRCGDWQTARAEQARAVQLIRLLAGFGYLAAAKHVLELLGVSVGPVRPPLRPLGHEEKTRLQRQLDDSGLWDAMVIGKQTPSVPSSDGPFVRSEG